MMTHRTSHDGSDRVTPAAVPPPPTASALSPVPFDSGNEDSYEECGHGVLPTAHHGVSTTIDELFRKANNLAYCTKESIATNIKGKSKNVGDFFKAFGAKDPAYKQATDLRFVRKELLVEQEIFHPGQTNLDSIVNCWRSNLRDTVILRDTMDSLAIFSVEGATDLFNKIAAEKTDNPAILAEVRWLIEAILGAGSEDVTEGPQPRTLQALRRSVTQARVAVHPDRLRIRPGTIKSYMGHSLVSLRSLLDAIILVLDDGDLGPSLMAAPAQQEAFFLSGRRRMVGFAREKNAVDENNGSLSSKAGAARNRAHSNTSGNRGIHIVNRPNSEVRPAPISSLRDALSCLTAAFSQVRSQMYRAVLASSKFVAELVERLGTLLRGER